MPWWHGRRERPEWGAVSVYETPSTPPTAGKPQYPRWIWVMAGCVVVIVAVVAVVLARVGLPAPDTAGDAAVEQLIPQTDAKIFQQEPVGIDLAPGYDGKLALNGTPIPDDQVDATPQLNLITFTPGPGKAVEQYDAGQNCVLATYWLIEDGPGIATSRGWCFSVV